MVEYQQFCNGNNSFLLWISSGVLRLDQDEQQKQEISTVRDKHFFFVQQLKLYFAILLPVVKGYDSFGKTHSIK